MITHTTTPKADSITTYINHGCALQNIGEHEQALLQFNTALTFSSNNPTALFCRANSLYTLKRFDEALSDYNCALTACPNDVLFLGNRAAALQALGRHEETITTCTTALSLAPNHVDILFNRGLSYQALQQYQEALKDHQRIINLAPTHIGAQFNLGICLQLLNNLNDAIVCYQQVLLKVPSHVQALCNIGIALQVLKRDEEALNYFNAAIKTNPEHAEAFFNQGNALQALDRCPEALVSYTNALTLIPDYEDALLNRGNVLRELGKTSAALNDYDHALLINPHNPEVHLNQSLCRLLLGNFKQGWPQYEARWDSKDIKKNKIIFKKPLWLGEESLEGKTILLYSEQGLGDAIQFCRYIKFVKARGAHILLWVLPALKNLFAALDGVDQVLTDYDVFPPFDYHCPLLSLPLAFKTDFSSIPNEVPYLYSTMNKQQAWTNFLGEKKKPRIGLVWSGSTIHKNDKHRSIALNNFITLLRDDVEFICLQKEFRESDMATLKAHKNISIVADKLLDFSDTAALLDHIDLVISIDTSVAHLAAAMNKPVWILIPFDPDWRWLLNRNDSPWYPNMRLFRQAQINQWEDVIQQIKNALTQWMTQLPPT